MIERKVGEVFEVNGEWFIVERASNCENCHFHGKECVTNYRLKNFGECSTTKRSNSTSVSFIKLEKEEEEKEVSESKKLLDKITDLENDNVNLQDQLRDLDRVKKGLEYQIKKMEEKEEEGKEMRPLTLIDDNCQTFRIVVGMSTFSSAGLDEQFVREIAKRTDIVRCLREYMESAKKHNIMVELTIDVRAVNGNGFKVEHNDAPHKTLAELARYDDHGNIEHAPYVGDIVMLKSGGPKMIVAAHFPNDNLVTCDWRKEDGTLCSANFRSEQLVKIKEESK